MHSVTSYISPVDSSSYIDSSSYHIHVGCHQVQHMHHNAKIITMNTLLEIDVNHLNYPQPLIIHKLEAIKIHNINI